MTDFSPAVLKAVLKGNIDSLHMKWRQRRGGILKLSRQAYSIIISKLLACLVYGMVQSSPMLLAQAIG